MDSLYRNRKSTRTVHLTADWLVKLEPMLYSHDTKYQYLATSEHYIHT